jgi:hypothetical protein
MSYVINILQPGERVLILGVLLFGAGAQLIL